MNESADRTPRKHRPKPVESDEPPNLPDRPADEHDEAWGDRDRAGERDRAWYERERPPHHQ